MAGRDRTASRAGPPDGVARMCGVCSAALRFSHREHAGRGEVRVVFRCTACGATSSHTQTQGDDDGSRMRSRKAPVDEGPPQNRVIDPDLARRLLESLGDGGDGPPA